MVRLGIWGLGVWVKVQGRGFRVQGLGFRDEGLGIWWVPKK